MDGVTLNGMQYENDDDVQTGLIESIELSKIVGITASRSHAHVHARIQRHVHR